MEAAVWVHQEKTETGISAISSAQTEFEETVSKQVGDFDTENQETQLDIQAMWASVDKQNQSLHKELIMRIQGTQINIQVMKMLTEATRHGHET
jgi:hypothetical protein